MKIKIRTFISLELDIVVQCTVDILCIGCILYRILIISGAVYCVVDHIISLIIIVCVQRKGYL